MSLQHALLTSLLEQPASGYDLSHRFDRSIGYFWHATHQQIYRELGHMANNGWIRAEETGGEARRRKVFHVLPAGRAELERWVRTAKLSLNATESLLVKLRADAAIGPLGLREQLRDLIEQHRERLHLYRRIEQRDFAGGLDRTGRLQYAVLQRGIMQEENWLSWAEDLLPLLDDPRP